MNSPTPPDPNPQYRPGRFAASGTWDRLRTWLIGIGIGTVIGGMLLAAKYQAVQREKAESQGTPAASDSNP